MSEHRQGDRHDRWSSLHVVARRDFLYAGAAVATAAIVPVTRALSPASASPAATEQDRLYMDMALQRMREAGVIDKTGGPFGAVVVLGDKVLSTAGNSVVRDNDPSAHAELNALREACRQIGSPHVDGAVLYSTCEPCPMCYATAYWARVGKIFYAASWSDYADLFGDANIAKDMSFPYEQRQVTLQQIMRPEAVKVWDEFRNLPDGARY